MMMRMGPSTRRYSSLGADGLSPLAFQTELEEPADHDSLSLNPRIPTALQRGRKGGRRRRASEP